MISTQMSWNSLLGKMELEKIIQRSYTAMLCLREVSPVFMWKSRGDQGDIIQMKDEEVLGKGEQCEGR